jgi:hypothetical protein
MGFKDTVDAGALEASFISVTVYEVRGVVPPDGVTEAIQSKAAGVEYRLAISKSVNSGCQALIGDNFVESEDEWRTEVKSQGPYALIAVGPTEYFVSGDGRKMQAPDGSLATYDCFPSARDVLRGLGNR